MAKVKSRAMERSSPISAAPKPRTSATASASPSTPLGANAPSVALPLRFVLTGLLALLAGILCLLLRPDLLTTYHYNQYVIAVTHLFTLGFVTSIIMGAMYQLVPVALETRLHSERLAKWQFVFHVVGFTGMFWMFWVWDLKQVGHFGSALAVGVGLFVYNITRTLRRVPRWNVIATAVASALVWLSLAVLAGLAVAVAKCSYDVAPQSNAAQAVAPVLAGLKAIASFLGRFDQMSTMHAHAHLGGIGFFVMLIVGVSYKLVPMFTLSEQQSERRAQWSVWLLNTGLAGSFFTILLRSPLKLGFALVVIAGLVVYGWEMRAILRARKRRVLDWGIKYFLTAISVLGLQAVLAVILSWPKLPLTALTGQLENLYGFLAVVGVVTFAILGMLYKIVPFLVWYARYSREIGRSPVPALADLYSPRLQAAGYWTYLGGLIGVSAAIMVASEKLMPWCFGLLAASVLIFVVNAARILSHLRRPKTEPLVPRSTTRSVSADADLHVRAGFADPGATAPPRSATS